MQQHPRELMLEDLGVVSGGEIALVFTGTPIRLHHAIDELTQSPLARVSTDRTAEVLGRDDGGSVDRPEVGKLDAPLFEDGLSGSPVLLDDVAPLPCDLVV